MVLYYLLVKQTPIYSSSPNPCVSESPATTLCSSSPNYFSSVHFHHALWKSGSIVKLPFTWDLLLSISTFVHSWNPALHSCSLPGDINTWPSSPGPGKALFVPPDPLGQKERPTRSQLFTAPPRLLQDHHSATIHSLSQAYYLAGRSLQ